MLLQTAAQQVQHGLDFTPIPVELYTVILTAAGQGKVRELITNYSNADAKSDTGRSFGGVVVHKKT